MPRKLSRAHNHGTGSPLLVLLGLLGLVALPVGLLSGLLQPAAQAASTPNVGSTLAAAQGCSAADFEAARLFDVRVTGYGGAFPSDLALGDFNGDGRADMAMSHRGQAGVSAIISILLDDGAGGFNVATPIAYFPASALNRVVTADFNGDGKTDLAAVGTISQPFAHVVSVSLGNGDGTFAAPINMTGFSGQNPWDIAVGEFNADGKPDLVVVNGGTQNYSILFGNGAGGFSLAAIRDVGTRFDRVAVGDFNGDARQDIVVTDSEDHRVLVLLNEQNGQFGVAQSVTVPNFPSAVVVGDFNADGKPDIAVASQFSSVGLPTDDGSVSVLLNDGAGSFAAPVNYRVGAVPADMTAADFDGDGKLDLAVGLQQSLFAYVLSGDGAGAFSNATAYEFPAGHTAIVAHDFNGDAHVDLAGIAGNGSLGILFGKTASPRPCLLADDVTVTEGDAGTSNADVIVRLSEGAAQEVKVNYTLTTGPAPDSAVEGQDFNGIAGTLTFAPGETVKVISIPIIGDTLHEFDETFTLTLSAPLNARLSDGAAKVTITNNDPEPSLSVNDVSVTETNTGFGSTDAVFTVSLSAPSSKVVRVDYAASAGTATAGNDFFAASGRVFFAPGSTSVTFSVPVGGDNTDEPDETFFVNLSDPHDAVIADGQGLGTILDNDPAPAITALSTVGSELTGADGTATLTVRLSNPSSQTVSVDYATADASAQAGADYVAAAGTLNFAPGETQKTVALTIKDDALDEVYETFLVNLSNPTNATIAVGQASCQIIDNDGPALSINDVSVVEGQSGRVSATFTLTLSAPSPQGISVRAQTTNGTTETNTFNTADYQQITNRTVFFAPNATTATFTVFVNGDLMIEPDETFFVDLSQPQDCTIADARGVGTIVNDDVTSVRFAAGALSVNEKDGSLLVTVERVGDLSGVFSAAYASFDNTATDRSDYIDVRGELRFEPGETSKTFSVFITDDALVEAPETFNLMLSGVGGGATNQPSVIPVTINSDDVVAGPNPIDSTDFFVRQHYRDFLNREPDASGLAFWTGEIEQCGADAACREVKRINVSAAFFLSIEFQETGYLIYRAHKAIFNGVDERDVPLYRETLMWDMRTLGNGLVVGADGWQQRLEQNKQKYFNDLVTTSPFDILFPPSQTPEQFVDALNANAGGALSAAERDALVAELKANTKTRAQALRAVVEDADLARAEVNRAFVLMQYFGYLRRNPDYPPDFDFSGYRFWLAKLNEFGGNYIAAEMVKAFISSDEYRKRFGQ